MVPPTVASTAHESTASTPATGSSPAEQPALPPTSTAPAPLQVVPAEGPAPVSASRPESSSTPPRSLSVEQESDSGHSTTSSSDTSSSSPSDRSVVHVTPDVVVPASALSTSGTVVLPADNQQPRSPSPEIDQFPSPPASPPQQVIAQVRQPLPPVETFLRPPSVSRQLVPESPVTQVRPPPMVVRTPTRPFPLLHQSPALRRMTGRSPYLRPGRFLPSPSTRFRLPPPAMPDPPFQVPRLKFRPLQFVSTDTQRPRTPSPPRFRSSSPSTPSVPSDDSSPNFRSSCSVPSQGRRPITRACKSPSTRPSRELPQDAQRISSTEESTTSEDDDWQSTASSPRKVAPVRFAVPASPRTPWSWRTARLDAGALFRTPPLSRIPMASRSMVLLPRARRQPLRSITPPLSPTSELVHRRRWLKTIQIRQALDPYNQPRVAAVPIDLLSPEVHQHLVRSAEHSELTAQFSVPGAAAQRRASERPRRSCVNSPVQEPSSSESVDRSPSPDDNLTSGYDSPNLSRRLQRRS